MKFAVYLALIGVAACQQLPEETEDMEDWEDLKDEEDLDEMLDITFNGRNRRLENLSRAQRKAWRNLQEGIGKKFGKKFQDLGRRYGPVGNELARSKAVYNRKQWEEKMNKGGNLNAFKFDQDAKQLKCDLFGCRKERYGRAYWERSMYERSFEYTRLERKNDGGRRRKMAKIHFSNSDMKDILEDVMDMGKNMDRVWMDRDLVKQGFKLDLAISQEDSYKKILNMLKDDINAHSWGEFGKRIGEFGKKMKWASKNCPLMVRMRKINERMFREVVSAFKITDLPKDARMRWVNRITNDLVKQLQGDPRADVIQAWKQILRRSMRGLAYQAKERFFRAFGNDRDYFNKIFDPQE